MNAAVKRAMQARHKAIDRENIPLAQAISAFKAKVEGADRATEEAQSALHRVLHMVGSLPIVIRGKRQE